MTARRQALATALVMSVVALSGCAVGEQLAGIQDPPQARTTGAALGAEQARTILRRVFDDVQRSGSGTSDATRARENAYLGPALDAAKARAVLTGGTGSPVMLPEQPNLLAVSHGPGYPRALVAQTVPGGNGLPVLHLLVSPDVATPFRLVNSATMLPASSVRPFEPLRAGSAVSADGTGLAIAPKALLDAYASALSFSHVLPTTAPFTTDAFLRQVRDSATAQARTVISQATFTQTHTLVAGSTYAVQQSGGGALVFGVLERTDTFLVKSGQVITAPARFVTLVPGKSKITRKAAMTTLEFLVFAVPKGSGHAVLVAASDQLVSAAGS